MGAVVPLTVISSQLPTLGKALPKETLVALISIFPLLSGGLRPFFGYFADRVGIVRSTIILNSLLTLGALLLFFNQVVASTILVGLAGGSMITLYFNVSGEIFGTRFSTVNSGILYTGKALGGILGSTAFAFLYVISPNSAYLYDVSCGLLGVLGLLAVALMKRVKG